jgi:hypothetical protein
MPQIVAKPHQTQLLISPAYSADLMAGVNAAKEFPGGYAQIAKLLKPGMLWIAWKYVATGERSGMAYDGLVSLDDRFAWFPKPWKVIQKGVTPLGHYAN